jgi:tetratricopeptide (TPR) repeat protein
MNRGGSTVQYQIVTELIETRNLGISIGWIDRPTAQVLKTLDNVARRKDKFVVVKCHDYTPEAAKYIEEGFAKGIYIYRDLRDVTVSLANKFFNSVEEVLKSRTLPNILYNYYGWTALPGVMVSQYERSIFDLTKETLKICAHLEIDITEKAACKTAAKYSLDRQLAKIENFNYQQDGVFNQTNDFYDPLSQLHNRHIKSGKSGQWQEVLSTKQIAEIENIAYSWSIDRGYELSMIKPDKTHKAKYYHQLGIKAAATGDLPAAIAASQQAIALSPKAFSYHERLGEYLYNSQMYLAASSAYRHTISLKPQAAEYYYKLGLALFHHKHFDRSMDAYLKAIKLQPSTAQFHRAIAEVLVEIGQPEKAIMHLKTAISLDK